MGAIMVAKRARAELGVELVTVIMMERGAAQYPLFTDVGAERLRLTPAAFFEYWNPMVYLLWKNSGENGKRTLDMWATDQIMEQETLEVGYHLLKCPMLALQAEASIRSYVNLK